HFDGPGHGAQAGSVLALHQLPPGPPAAVAEVVDVVDRALTVFQGKQVTHGHQDVLLRERRLSERRLLLWRHIRIELVVQLQASDRRQIVSLRIEEEVLKQRFCRIERGGITRAQAPIDLHDRFVGGRDLVGNESIAQVWPNVQAINEQDVELLDARLMQTLQRDFGDLLVRLQQHLASIFVYDVIGGYFTNELRCFELHTLDASNRKLLDRGARELRTLPNEDFSVHDDIVRGALPSQQSKVDALLNLLAAEKHRLALVEEVQDLLSGHPQCPQQYRGVHLTAPV